MRELKLKYIIELVSDISRKAKTDEIALSQAQKKIQQELSQTNTQLGRMERLLLKVNGLGSASAERQAAYLSKLALRYQDVRRAAEGASNAMTKVAAVGAGATAGALAADRLTKAPMDYSLRLAHMANTAYADRGVAGRIAGKNTLESAITAALRVGGGKRDDAAGALDALIASGTMPVAKAIKMLPMLMRSSSASGADPVALGNIGIRSMQSFNVGIGDIPQVLDMSMAAGQAGGFELKDMARWLPQAMAAGSQSGLTGIEGLRRILASMQASVITAGSKDEAGNNLVNLLAKINSRDTATDFHKQGIDLPAKLAEARSKGVNSLDAFVGLVDTIANKEPEYVALRKKLEGTTDPGARTETLQSMASILQGKAVGQVVQDRQALMGLLAEMNNRPYIASVMDRTRASGGAIDTAFGVIQAETGFKREQMGNEGAIAAQKAFDKLTPALGAVFDTSSDVARQFPLLTAGVVGATGALAVFTAALGASGLVGLLTGKAGSAGMVGTMVGGTLAKAATGAAWTLGPLAALYGGLNLGSWARTDVIDPYVLNRGGVKLSADAKARLSYGLPTGPGVPGAPDLLSLTGPGSTGSSLAGATLGEGKLAVDVKVSDDRVSASTRVVQPLAGFRINPGATNPGGFTP